MLNRFLNALGGVRRLLLAILLSLLVHVWMIGGLEGWLPDGETPETTLIRVELVSPPKPEPVKKALPVKHVPPVSHPLPRPSPRPAVKPPGPMAPVPATPVPVVSNVPVETAAPAAVSPAPATAPSAAPPAVEEPPVAEVEAPVPKVPARVELDYQIVRKGGVAGVEHHAYHVTEDGRYVLTSIAEASGLLALALSDLVQRSEGQVTPHGLRPDSFLYQYGKNTEKAQKATFDWAGKQLTMEVGSRKQTVALEDGAQDLMSFMYQFMFVPPLQEMRLVVTNGKKLKVYNYDFEGEESLATRMGSLRTLRIGKSSSEGEEKTEMWLAADYHYLPVKISKTEKDGTVTERIATSLQIQE